MHGDDSDKVDAEDDRVFVKNGKKDGLRKVFRVGIVSVLVVALVAFGVVKLINGGFDALMKQVGWVQDEIRKDDPQYKINSVTVGSF